MTDWLGYLRVGGDGGFGMLEKRGSGLEQILYSFHSGQWMIKKIRREVRPVVFKMDEGHV
jgi:hypothetical protein